MRKVFLFFLIAIGFSCSPSREEKAKTLYHSYCASCHLAPDIGSLPRDLWATKVLPQMGARLGMPDSLYDPLKGLSFAEREAVLKTGVFPYSPLIKKEDWDMLREYILDMAPDSLAEPVQDRPHSELVQFRPVPISLDTVTSSLYTFLKFDQDLGLVYFGDTYGRFGTYDYAHDTLVFKGRLNSAITGHAMYNGAEYVTTVGFLDPSSIASGRIFRKEGDKGEVVPEILHRPVHTLVRDLDQDGTEELIVSEFGDLSGALTLLVRGANGQYQKKTLLAQPGTIRVLAADMNGDGLEDLVALTSQGDESITVLYQEKDLDFRPEKVIRFSPIYGSSWFELVDYDGDGHLDIVTVHGDNADDTYVHKPYHGMRIHINDGKNGFEEQYFYPLNGATRVIAKDFDQDGDLDFGLLSTFPDYDGHPDFTFVYLENKNAKAFEFEPFTFNESKLGRWFLMDSGDIDHDGDEDIILSAFSYAYTPFPKHLMKLWQEHKVDLMVLENKLH